jgi:hypothetical protein
MRRVRHRHLAAADPAQRIEIEEPIFSDAHPDLGRQRAALPALVDNDAASVFATDLRIVAVSTAAAHVNR